METTEVFGRASETDEEYTEKMIRTMLAVSPLPL